MLLIARISDRRRLVAEGMVNANGNGGDADALQATLSQPYRPLLFWHYSDQEKVWLEGRTEPRTRTTMRKMGSNFQRKQVVVFRG